MNVLVVGSGGREHAYVHALAKSPGLGRLFAAPGNAGMAAQASCLDIGASDVPALVAAAQELDVGLVVVGPEAPLVAGLVDACEAVGIPAMGPSKAAAHLEGSKAFMKELCRKARIPTAGYKTFNAASEAIAYAEGLEEWPVVVKADGLAAGKGVIIAQDAEQAVAAVRELMLDKRFGDAGARVVFEDFLVGEELSVMALVDGETLAVLEPSRDHKAAFDGDTGPNTGGMGAFSPSRLLTRRAYEQIEERVLLPTISAMAAGDRPFRGILYAGLMLTEDGPMVLEFNVRGGDPEIEVLMPRLQSDALELFHAAATGRLAEMGDIEWDPRAACGVVLADGDYPGAVTPGKPIWGVEKAAAHDDVVVLHMGTGRKDGELVTAGGRVLCVVGLGDGLADAQAKAYAAAKEIRFPGMRLRGDIGWRELDGVSGGVTV